jgi:hypothetical protein
MDLLRHAGHVAVMAPMSLRALVREKLEAALRLNPA